MNLSNRQIFLKHIGQTSGKPLMLEVEKAHGVKFIDTKGKAYYDLVSGVSVSSVGHGNPDVIRAVKEQADRHMHLMVYGEIIQSPQSAYASWLVSHLPGNLDNIYFVNSGSEAIEGAMKLAKRVTRRPEVVAFHQAYHGSTHGAMSIMGDPDFHQGFLPLLPGIRHLEFNCKESLDQISSQTACVVVEPIQAEAGIIEPTNDFLKALRERCSETGALLVFDEVQTGFGRTGAWFAFEHFGVVPDILCVAKSFGGGMPLGAFISSTELMNSLTFNPPLGHITTFGGHPVSCAAGLAAQQYIEQHHLIEHGNAMGLLYRELVKHESVKEIRGRGLFLAVVLEESVNIEAFMQAAFDQGIVLDQFLFCRNAFRIAPPLVISEDEVKDSSNRLISALELISK